MAFIGDLHHLLIDHCTRSKHDHVRSRAQRQRYVDQVARILAGSRLEERTDAQIWALGWDKPFFAYNAASAVGPAVERARAAGVFSDREAVTSPQFMTNATPGPMVAEAIARGHLTGACAVPFRLARVQAYARAVPRITQEVNRFYAAWQSAACTAHELQEMAVAIAEDIGAGGGPIGKVQGFGFTTACHLLADLGLPVYKPDIWVCRIVSSLPGVRAQLRRAWQLADEAPLPFNFLESKLQGARAPDAYRRIVQPVMNALVQEAQLHDVAAAEFDLAPAFVRTRFVDWTLVHLAISAETEVFGLERRPVDVLCAPGDAPLPAHLRALARWLEAGQAAHEAEVALKNAQSKVRLASTPRQAERAQARWDLLRTPDAQARRQALADQAQTAWRAHEEATAEAGWQLDARYPEGHARRTPTGAWAYKRAALARRG